MASLEPLAQACWVGDCRYQATRLLRDESGRERGLYCEECGPVQLVKLGNLEAEYHAMIAMSRQHVEGGDTYNDSGY